MSSFSNRNRPQGNPSKLANACGIIFLAVVATVFAWGAYSIGYWLAR